MKRILRFCVVVCLMVASTSCLDIKEEISLNKDGSGKYSMAIDMSEIMTMLSSMMSEEQMSEQGDVFGSMDSSLLETVEKLRAIDGISNVSHRSENYKFTISYKFDDITSLNSASKIGPMGNSNGESTLPADKEDVYAWTPTTFERQKNPEISDLLNQGEDEEGMMEMAKMMMADAKYTTVYRFPGKVKKVQNSEAELSEKDKTVTLELSLLDIMEGKANVGNKIKFKKR